MRRDQTNSTSSPVRNMLSNPSGETLSGGIVVTRTNYALNPRFISGGYFAGYQAQNYAAVTGLVGHPEGITTAARVTYSAGNTNPGVTVTLGLDASTQYTVSAWVFQETQPATGAQVALALKGQSSSANINTTLGVWEKLTWTMTTAAGIGGGNDFGIRAAGTPGEAGSFLVTGVLVEKLTPTVSTFFDGSTPAAGDFSYAWAGAVNNSVSRQQGNTLASISGVGSASAIQSGDWAASGTKSVRLISQVASSDTYTTLGGDVGGLRAGMEVGKTYTVMGISRLPAALTTATHAARLAGISIFTRIGTGAYTEYNTSTLINAIGVYQHRRTFTVPEGATEAFIRVYNGSAIGGGDVWWDNLMLVEGTYAGEYVDGSKALAKWDGAAHNSTSAGYPPSLWDIAGPPTLEKIGIGSTTNSVVDGFVARTVYIVYEVIDTNASWQTPVYYGSNAPADGITFQTAAAGSLSLSPRLDFTAGSGDINKGQTLGNARQVRRHVVAAAFNQGLTAVNYSNNGTNVGPQVINPGTVGWTSGQLRNNAPSSIKALYSAVYYVEHDSTTRQAISRYLGNKYGANVA